MVNFEFCSPTKVFFGKDQEKKVGEIIKGYGASKVLLHYGGGSIKRNGLYDTVVKSLKEAGIDFVELGGVKPNPRVSLVREGIALGRREGVDFILAVGGGSTIDSAKAIGVGIPYDGDVWDFYDKSAVPAVTLPVATILTIAAAGSEMSPSSVITNEDGWFKRGLDIDLIRPVFSILNPALTCSVPAYQTACGAADIMAHIMERYFTNVDDVDYSDRLCEASMQSVIRALPKVLKNTDDYAARAEIMWTGCVAHNDLLSCGRIGDWASHMIEHEVSGIYDIAHGAGLAICFPAWMKYVYKHNITRFVQFAVRVWGVDNDFYDPEATALKGIERLENFLRYDCALPTRFSDVGIGDDRFEEMADKATANDTKKIGNFVKLSKQDIVNIYSLAK
ncbi:MAG: iron-containing alcohol dehydrogenase [Hungateiclostridium thermocellum]|nr:iron-containing alcohol dehydrogenase [Acetivibrio thermocellus]